MTQTYKKKLIEVSMPLEAINRASVREKSIKQGHPASLHQWWARRPLASCRAVLFAQMVDDPSNFPDEFPSAEAIEIERNRLFKIIEDLVQWENSTNDELLSQAKKEITKSCSGKLPSVYDPFSGGGTIPLEAQRLGLPAFGSDLNPVAVMIGKSMLEMVNKFSGLPPVNPDTSEQTRQLWGAKGVDGIAQDISFYAEKVLNKTKTKTAYMYPEITLPKKYGSGKASVISWIWARTVPSPNPGINHLAVPLIKNFQLSKKSNNKKWCKLVLNDDRTDFTFNISDVADTDMERTIGRNAGVCAISGDAIPFDYIRKTANSEGFGNRLVAVVADGPGGRIYLPPSVVDETAITSLTKPSEPSIKIDHWSGCTNCVIYGFKNFEDLYTPRQFRSLIAFSEAISEIKEEILQDSKENLKCDQSLSLSEGGKGPAEYADTIVLFLSFALSKLADLNNSFCGWEPVAQCPRHLFGKQAIPMVWDYAEANPFSKSSGSWHVIVRGISNALKKSFSFQRADIPSRVFQADAVEFPNGIEAPVVCMDPPYYDNIPYSNLSDFFYMWLKKVNAETFANEFSTLGVPKSSELVANKFRQGSKEKAEQFFIDGMNSVFKRMATFSNEDFPSTIFYAFKQSEVSAEGISSTGWSTFLEAIINSGFAVVGTWPIRTENASRMMGQGNNALATSVVLVIRKRSSNAETVTRSEFIRTLQSELPGAISELQRANVSPADMPQSAIGPGIGIFSRYAAVMEPNDNSMTVKTALQLINAQLDEFLNDLHGEFDPETRFTASWFEQNGYARGEFGAANSLATARGIAVESVKHAGIIESSAGKVRILKRDELDPDWDPNSDTHLTIWECCQYLVKKYEDGGETAAAMLVKKMGYDRAEAVKDLAYYLYDICSNKRQDAKEATSYNALIAGWNDITRTADSIHDMDTTRQASLF